MDRESRESFAAKNANAKGENAKEEDAKGEDAKGANAPTSRRQRVLAAMSAIQRYERGLSERLIGGLLQVPGLTFYGIRDPERFGERTPTVSFRLAGLSPRQVAEALGERGIFVWDGNYYALGLSERLGVEPTGGMVRVGLVHYNTAAEVDVLLEALGELARA